MSRHLKGIARYEDILNNYDSMAEVIIEDLDAIKKTYARKRRTIVENAEEAVFEEKKIEEQEVVFLMDRFGYARTVDVSTYERNREAADSENKYIVSCLNTGKNMFVYECRKDASGEGAGYSIWKIQG